MVLLSYYDPFDGAKFNNSERVAAKIRTLIGQANYEIMPCRLQTVFDKAYKQIEECLKSMVEPPILIIGLGEGGCNVKVEMMARNKDKTFGPDNEGQERNNSSIISEASPQLGFNYPLPQMYCGLPQDIRSRIDVSNNAGSFVCNNTAFQLTYHYPEIPSGFIHVPINTCWGLDKKTEMAATTIEKMISSAVNYLLSDAAVITRFPVKKKELDLLQDNYSKKDKCLSELFKRSRGVDE